MEINPHHSSPTSFFMVLGTTATTRCFHWLRRAVGALPASIWGADATRAAVDRAVNFCAWLGRQAHDLDVPVVTETMGMIDGGAGMVTVAAQVRCARRGALWRRRTGAGGSWQRRRCCRSDNDRLVVVLLAALAGLLGAIKRLLEVNGFSPSVFTCWFRWLFFDFLVSGFLLWIDEMSSLFMEW